MTNAQRKAFAEYRPIVEDAARAMRNEPDIQDVRSFYASRRCCATSTHGDIALIVWNTIYWTGHIPNVRPTRGNAYILDIDGFEFIARVSDPYDHREGVIKAEVSR